MGLSRVQDVELVDKINYSSIYINEAPTIQLNQLYL